MAFWSNWFGGAKPPAASPRALVQDAGGGLVVATARRLDEALRSGSATASGATVTPDSAMRAAAVHACVRIIPGAVATLPLHVKRRVDERTREDASDTPLWTVLRKRPHRWQTSSQFRRMLQAHLLLRGNACAMIVRSRGQIFELIPLHPDRVEVSQADDLALAYSYTRPDGRRIKLAQTEVFHLVGLTLDGVHGVSAISYARETIGLSLAMEDHGAAKREYAQAFDRFFRRGVDAGLRDLEVKAKLTTQSDPDGGYLVPEETEASIDRVLGAASTIRALARAISISTSAYKKLVNMGGATSGWVGEEQDRGGTATPTLREIAINAGEIHAMPGATQTSLDDARIDLASWLAEEAAIEFAEREGAAFAHGGGVNKPRGVLAYDRRRTPPTPGARSASSPRARPAASRP